MSKSKKTAKTNAVRLVEREGIEFSLIECDVSDELTDGVSVAMKTGQAVETVFKTLVTRATDKSLHVFLLPVAQELDMKKAAKAAGVKKLDMLPLKDLTKETGYIRGGCSPIGMKRNYPTVIDSSAATLERIVISAGRPGFQMAVHPSNLVSLTQAKYEDISQS